ncbi:MAG: type B 50S ribosomal protein L31 [Cumulibacter sp.]
MRKDIHPDYHPVVFEDMAVGTRILTRTTATSQQSTVWEDGNTYPLIQVETSSASHPFWTGKGRIMDTEGRVEKFNKRYARTIR